MTPIEVFIALPIPFLLALILLSAFHLLPLLHLLPSGTPFIQRLKPLIPLPRRTRNLPREFFNLPPRPGSPAPWDDVLTIGVALGVRGKVILVLIGQAALSLICGWVYLAAEVSGKGSSVLLALSLLPLPSSILMMSIFSVLKRPAHVSRHELALWRSAVFGSGGITHSTLLPRILPYSTLLTITSTVLVIAVPAAGPTCLAILGLHVALTIGTGVLCFKNNRETKRGMIRLTSPSFVVEEGEKNFVIGQADSDTSSIAGSWVSSPSRPPTPVTAFSYSPSTATFHSNETKTLRSRSESQKTQSSYYATPKSTLTESTTTPSTIPSWDFSHTPASQDLASPQSVLTRSRPTSPISPEIARGPKGSLTTIISSPYTVGTSTPGSALHSPGGSIIAGYSPDIHRPIPQGYESLASYPGSQSQFASQESLGAWHQSSSDISFIPTPATTKSRSPGFGRGSSLYTLESINAHSYQTPKNQIKRPSTRQSQASRRAPPPPPIPVDMPLPPTPTVARTESMWDDQSSTNVGKGSTELLMSTCRDREWDFIDREEGEGLAEWEQSGNGVGLVALIGVAVIAALAAPLLVAGHAQTNDILYLLALLVPTPLLVLSTFLLRPNPISLPTRRNLNNGSKASTSTHRSLALLSESQLSLPITVSPKLTPPIRQHSNVPLAEKWKAALQPKPSISIFGYQKPVLRQMQGHRRHTVYGISNQDIVAEEVKTKMMNRRSTDTWLETGHAKPYGNVLKRASEMMKAYPALRVMEDERDKNEGGLTKLRGGVMSMIIPRRFSQIHDHSIPLNNFDLPRQRASGYVDHDDDVPASPITINITSPSKFEKRKSALSFASPGYDGSDSGYLENEITKGEIVTATRARMSASPTFMFTKQAEQGGVDLDWVQAGILPQLLPEIILPSRPVSKQFSDADESSPRKRQTSFRSSASHGRSSSVEYHLNTAGPLLHRHPVSTPPSNEKSLKHKHSFSLPLIDKASFSDLRKEMNNVGKDRRHNWSIYEEAPEGTNPGIDLPAFPVGLTRSHAPSSPDTPGSSNDADQSFMTVNTRHIAQLTLKPESLFAFTPKSTSSRQDDELSRYNHSHQMSPESGIGALSMISTDEAAAREMEVFLKLDTPTRAELVISPTPSEATTVTPRTNWSRMSDYDDRRSLSRASSMPSVAAEITIEKKISASTFGTKPTDSSFVSTPSDTSPCFFSSKTFTSSLEEEDIPPVPELPPHLRRPLARPASFNFAHPFPVHNTSAVRNHGVPAAGTAGRRYSAMDLRAGIPHYQRDLFATIMQKHGKPGSISPGQIDFSRHAVDGEIESQDHGAEDASDEENATELDDFVDEGDQLASQNLTVDGAVDDGESGNWEHQRMGRVRQEVKKVESRSKRSTPPTPDHSRVVPFISTPNARKGLKPLLLANRPISFILANKEKQEMDKASLKGDDNENDQYETSTPSKRRSIENSRKKKSGNSYTTPTGKKLSKKSNHSSTQKENAPPLPSGTPADRRVKTSKRSVPTPGGSSIRA